jgi:hypothetical protein
MRYGKIYAEIMANVNLSPRAKVVAAALDMRRNPKTGQCNPKLDKLMEDTGMTCKSTLHAALAELIDKKIISREKDGRKGFKREQCFTLPWGEAKVQRAERKQCNGSNGDSAGRMEIRQVESPYIMNEKEKEKEKEKDKELSLKEIMMQELAELRA